MRSALTSSPHYKWWVFVPVGTGIVTIVADLGTINVALPTIADYFGADLLTAQWIVVGYALTISALLMPMGRLSDIIGLKQVYVGGFLIFVVAAVLASISNSMLTLILARVLMGCGTAMTQGTSMAIVAGAFPSSQRGTAMGGLIGMVGVGAILGPPVGGFLVSALGWRWVFYVEVPPAVLSVVAALIILEGRRFRRGTGRPDFDWLGAALSIGAMVSFMMALTSGPRVGWSSPLIIGAAVSAAVLLGVFLWWELRSPAPMLDLRLFKRRMFSTGVLAASFSFMAPVPSFFLMPFYLQGVLGYKASQVGLIILPNAIAMMVMAALSGHLSDRYGRRAFMVGGQLIMAAGAFILGNLTVGAHLGMAMAGMFFIRCGSGIFESPNASSVLSGVDRERYGVGSAFLNLARNSANVTSVAMATAIITGTMAAMGHPPSLGAITESGVADEVLSAFTAGLRKAFLVLGFLVLAGAAVVLLKGGTPTGGEQD